MLKINCELVNGYSKISERVVFLSTLVEYIPRINVWGKQHLLITDPIKKLLEFYNNANRNRSKGHSMNI